MEAFSLWGVFAATALVVVIAIEGGFRLGRATHARSDGEQESPVSAIAAPLKDLQSLMGGRVGEAPR